MQLPSFIFNAQNDTPEAVARRRALAEAMLARGTTGVASNVGEGLAQLGQAISGRIGVNRADGIAAKRKAAAYGMLGPAFAPMAPAAAPDAPLAGGAGSDTLAGGTGGDIAGGIRSTADALGIDPVDLATAISYETAGTFNPTKGGPTTKWGKHRGLIQFGEPQAKQFGVDWTNPVGSQLGPDGAVAKYLRSTGVKPGMGMMDIYSAINAGRVGRYNRSDANAGGAPGTVADKVNNQMAGHRQKAVDLMAAQGQQPVAPPSAPMGTSMMAFPPAQSPQMAPQAPTVVPASAPPPMATQATASPQAPMSAYQRVMMQSLGKEAGGLAAPPNRAQAAAVMGNAQPMQSPFAPSAPMATPAPMAAPSSDVPGVPQAGVNRLSLLQGVITSPSFAWLEPAQQQFVMDEYKREQAAANPDPMAQVQLETAKVNLEKAKKDLAKQGIDTTVINGKLVNTQTGEVIYDGGTNSGEPKIVPKGASVLQPDGTWSSPPSTGAGATSTIEDPMKITKDYQSQDGFSRIKTIAPTIESMYKSLSDPSAMADLDFVYGLAKILDPTSVVRESEGKMVIDSQGIAPSFLGQLNKMLSGDQAMLPEARFKLFGVAMRRAQELQQQAEQERGFYSDMAKENQFNPDTYLQQVPELPAWKGNPIYKGDQGMRQPTQAAAVNPDPLIQEAAPPQAPDWQLDAIIKSGRAKTREEAIRVLEEDTAKGGWTVLPNGVRVREKVQ